jgi:hypothetical protein
MNFAAPRQLLQRFVVDLQQVRSLLTIEKRLELRYGKSATGFSNRGNFGEWGCHSGLLFLDNPQDFHRSPRLIQADLITAEHQLGIVGSASGHFGTEKDGRLHALPQEDYRVERPLT